MRHHEIDVGKGRLRIGGIAELNLWKAFSHQMAQASPIVF